MKTLLVLITGALCSLLTIAADLKDLKEENRYLGFLHKVQYVETIGNLKQLIPDCPAPKEYAGGGDSEIIVNTRLFGCDAVCEFNFHHGILVSHGFHVRTKTYKEAHHAFLEAVTILDSQVSGVKTSVLLPTDEDYMDCPSAPPDKITLYLDGTSGNAAFQLQLEMKGDSLVVAWGGQKVSPSESKQSDPAPPVDGVPSPL